jgi:hypothetical protein
LLAFPAHTPPTRGGTLVVHGPSLSLSMRPSACAVTAHGLRYIRLLCCCVLIECCCYERKRVDTAHPPCVACRTHCVREHVVCVCVCVLSPPCSCCCSCRRRCRRRRPAKSSSCAVVVLHCRRPPSRTHCFSDYLRNLRSATRFILSVSLTVFARPSSVLAYVM